MPNIDGWTSIYNKNGAYGLPVQTPGQIDQVTLTPVQGGGTVSTIQSLTLPITGGTGPVTDIEGVASVATLRGTLTLDQILNEIYSNPAYANYPFHYTLGEPCILGIQQCGMDYTGVQDIAPAWAIGLALVANNVNLEKLWIGAGLFTAKGPLASPSSFMTVEGASNAFSGAGATTIQADPTFAGGIDLLDVVSPGATVSNLTIKNLLISSAMAGPNCRGLVLQSTPFLRMDGVAFAGNFSCALLATLNAADKPGAHAEIGTLSIDMPLYNDPSSGAQLLPYPRSITCSVTAGSNVLTVTSGTLTSADYGSLVTMINSQTNGYNLSGTSLPIQPGSFLTAITSGTTATMNQPAGWTGTVTGLTVNIGQPIGWFIGNTVANNDVHNWQVQHLYTNSNGGPDIPGSCPPAFCVYAANSDSIKINKWHAYDGAGFNGGAAPNVQKWFGDYCTKVSGAGGLHPGDWLIERPDFDLSSGCAPNGRRVPAGGVDNSKGQFNIVKDVIWENGPLSTILPFPSAWGDDDLLIAPWSLPNLLAVTVTPTGSGPYTAFYVNEQPYVVTLSIVQPTIPNTGPIQITTPAAAVSVTDGSTALAYNVDLYPGQTAGFSWPNNQPFTMYVGYHGWPT